MHLRSAWTTKFYPTSKTKQASKQTKKTIERLQMWLYGSVCLALRKPWAPSLALHKISVSTDL